MKNVAFFCLLLIAVFILLSVLGRFHQLPGKNIWLLRNITLNTDSELLFIPVSVRKKD